MKTPYNHTEVIHNLNAAREVVPLLLTFIKPKSVLDVGCGTGTWLKVFEEHGISDYKGVDGGFLDTNLLKIPVENFVVKDLNQDFSLGRKFDLVISLEVAEHLNEARADQFVRTLTAHGDAILFSAAIPGQGGQNHINEQWPPYWQKRFEHYGFFFHDCIRPIIWMNENIDWWYRQNIFLLTKSKPEGHSNNVSSMVHFELYQKTMNDNLQYIESLTSGKQGIKVSAKIFTNALIYKFKSVLGFK